MPGGQQARTGLEMKDGGAPSAGGLLRGWTAELGGSGGAGLSSSLAIKSAPDMGKSPALSGSAVSLSQKYSIGSFPSA